MPVYVTWWFSVATVLSYSHALNAYKKDPALSYWHPESRTTDSLAELYIFFLQTLAHVCFHAWMFSRLIWLPSGLCHLTKCCYTAHINSSVEGHVACIWQKCSCFCVNNSEDYELMYCDWFFCCMDIWELGWPSCYQCCVIHVYVEWCLHVLVFNGLLFPSPANMQILWGQERCRNMLSLHWDMNSHHVVWGKGQLL